MYQRLKQASLTTLAAIRQPGSFVQNFALSFSATAAVTIIGFLLTPIISRLYPPSAYGQFAVFSSVLNNLMTVSMMTLPGALLLPKTRRSFYNLVNAVVIATAISAVLVLLFLLAFHRWTIAYLNVPDLGRWFFVLPVVLVLGNLSTVLGYWYMRKKAFKQRAAIDISTTLAGRGVTIGLGLLLNGSALGLLMGEFANRLTYFVGMMVSGIYRELRFLPRFFSLRGAWEAVREYKDFPLYVLPANYVHVLSVQAPIFLLTSQFGSTVVGLYSFSVGLLEMPLNLLGSAVAPVFMQKATEVFHTTPERLKDITLSIYYKLLYLGLLPFGVLTVFGDVLFKVVFGAKWELAGIFTAYLGYYYIFKLTSTVTVPVYSVIGKPRYQLLSNALLLVFRVGGLLLGFAMGEMKTALLLFGVGSLIIAFLTDLHLLHQLRVAVWQVAIRTVLLIAATVGVLWGVRWLIQPLLDKWL